MLEQENTVLSSLVRRFQSAQADKAMLHHHRVYLSLGADDILDALSYAKHALHFTHLCTITGMDTGDGYEFVYHLSNDDGIVLNLKYRTAGGDGIVIPSVLPIYEGATFYERELEGLLGVTVDGLPEGRQYPLPDNWPQGQYPLRKTWVPDTRKE